MAVIDRTPKVDTRKFFQTELGIIGTDALDELALAFGDTHAFGALKQIRDLVRHGCFRNATALQQELETRLGCYPGDPYGQVAIKALIATREFHDLPTLEQAALYLAEDCSGFVSLTLTEHLGDTVPDWFFPALVLLARGVSKHFKNHVQDKFVTLLGDCLEAWGYGNANTYGIKALAATLELSYHRLVKQAPHGEWLLLLPEELF